MDTQHRTLCEKILGNNVGASARASLRDLGHCGTVLGLSNSYKLSGEYKKPRTFEYDILQLY